ncbi:unnamed protein product [Kluyveromyces dobzhanskii CBS 2104]|uniref:RING-type E3 ubiquitin transferase n=1 Tax=Kluyveromyces dobzhanskii CBS 2104 TaxID=1427455 RepID=A0A0A8L9C0_9SACH|nr:unnamed protein product [Kluyveromyces dobzhanskii CBS 2104]
MAPAMQFPFADAPSIVQAHQKDDTVESLLLQKIQDVLKKVKGQRFTNQYVNEIMILSKLVYLSITTLRYRRTLGEEYVDLAYVDRQGNGVARLLRRIGFTISYCGVPWVLSKLFYKYKISERDSGLFSVFTGKSFKDVLDSFLNMHLILFYLSGQYYSISKRIFGMRYVIGHEMNKNEVEFKKRSSQNYKVLGLILGLQLTSKILPHVAGYISDRIEGDEEKTHKSLRSLSKKHVSKDLSDPDVLPFIENDSRKCVLCLNDMVDPSATACGHLFCWACIMEWTLERQECPLCRQRSLRQMIIPVR